MVSTRNKTVEITETQKDVTTPESLVKPVSIDHILSAINKKSTTAATPERKAPVTLKQKKINKKAALKLKLSADPEQRGVAISGRFWKTPKKPFRIMHNSVAKMSTQKHLKLRDELKRIREISNSIKEEKKQDNELKKQRRETNTKRRLENARKSETVQIIKDTSKIKRMKKKQLRMIEKRDLSTVKVV